jgi:hypothetical protein
MPARSKKIHPYLVSGPEGGYIYRFGEPSFNLLLSTLISIVHMGSENGRVRLEMAGFASWRRISLLETQSGCYKKHLRRIQSSLISIFGDIILPPPNLHCKSADITLQNIRRD